MEAARDSVAKMLAEVEEMHLQGSSVPALFEVAPHIQDGQQDLYHFSKEGPKCMRLWSVLVPDTNVLPPAMEAVAQERGREVLLYPAFDQTQQCGLDVEREVPIRLQQFLQQRLGHVSRSGPANCPSYILEMFVKLEAENLQGRRGRTLVLHPGTSAYYSRLRSNMGAMRRWLEVPTWSYTTCINTNTSECLATYVSHYCSTPESQVEVWTREDEVRDLVLLTGAVDPKEGDGYFTHNRGRREQEDGGEGTDCPYHIGCWRQDLEVWRTR